MRAILEEYSGIIIAAIIAAILIAVVILVVPQVKSSITGAFENVDSANSSIVDVSENGTVGSVGGITTTPQQ